MIRFMSLRQLGHCDRQLPIRNPAFAEWQMRQEWSKLSTSDIWPPNQTSGTNLYLSDDSL
jgi:hypothetical protein